MITVQLSCHLLPTGAPRRENPALYRNVERDWPGVPRPGDMVSLGGGDAMFAEVVSVLWSDGGVVLRFLMLTEDDRDALLELGFTPSGRPEPAGGWR